MSTETLSATIEPRDLVSELAAHLIGVEPLADFFEALGNAVTSCPECGDFSATAEACEECARQIDEGRYDHVPTWGELERGMVRP